MQPAAYNSRTPYMSSSLSLRSVGSLWFVLALLLAAPAGAQDWSGAEGQLAGKIVSAAGPKTMALEVQNRSSLSPAMTDDIRRNLLTQLAVQGVRFVAAEQAAANVRVTLSEDLQSFLWIAEIRSGANEPSIAMVSLPRSMPASAEPEAAAMVLRKIPLWSQPGRILDVAIVVELNPPHMLVLDADGVSSYRLQDNHWQPEQALPVVHSRPWPRDLRGRLVLKKDKDHLFDAYLPGVHCRSSAGVPLAMNCSENDDPWPVGTDLTILSSSFSANRNFFSGALVPGIGEQSRAPAFYSAAAVPGNDSTSWLLASVDGQIHFLDGSTDQVIEKLNWGSDIAALHSGCGSGWQVLATGSGAGPHDNVRAFELRGRKPVAASAPLEVSGNITAFWAEAGGEGVVAVARNSETERYEAFRILLSCGR
jgi:hypothetical protein